MTFTHAQLRNCSFRFRLLISECNNYDPSYLFVGKYISLWEIVSLCGKTDLFVGKTYLWENISLCGKSYLFVGKHISLWENISLWKIISVSGKSYRFVGKHIFMRGNRSLCGKSYLFLGKQISLLGKHLNFQRIPTRGAIIRLPPQRLPVADRPPFAQLKRYQIQNGIRLFIHPSRALRSRNLEQNLDRSFCASLS